MMKKLEAFQHGDGAHCGLSDWYKDGEAELTAVIAERVPFDTGWYSSKKEIASARIWSEDGVKIKVEASVSDDFDTEGLGYASTEEWTVDAVQGCVSKAWDKAEQARDEAQEFEGFTVLQHRPDGAAWVETYLVNIGWGENLGPPGDNYHWWGWQYDGADDTVGVPHPDIPLETVQAFEKWVHDWAFGRLPAENNCLRIDEWEIKPWRETRPQPEDPNDYAGMGWIGRDGRP
jgi:hypothetical protein